MLRNRRMLLDVLVNRMLIIKCNVHLEVFLNKINNHLINLHYLVTGQEP
jgi:hypothetical protein